MVHVQDLSAGFSLLSGLIAFFLFSLAARAYSRERDRAYGLLASAFFLFGTKSFIVAYAVWTGAIEHQLLELVDAIGDLGTILLIAMPLILPRPQ